MIIASVPHTGSRFTQSLFQKKPVFLHVYKGESIEEIIKHSQIIVPLRHPLAVAQSWVNRGKPIRWHPKHEAMCVMWRTLIDVVAPLLPMYLPLDLPSRDHYLHRISAAIGEKLDTDWSTVSDNLPSKPLTDDDKSAVAELMADPFFAKMGYL